MRGKNMLNFASLILKDRIPWKHDFVNGEIRIEMSLRQIFKKLSYLYFYNYITGIFQAKKIKIVQLKSGFWLRSSL